jgi:hypothetical protein
MNNICTMEASVSGSILSRSDMRCGGPPDRQLPDGPAINSGRSVGIAFGSAGGFTGWVLGRAGRDANTLLNLQRKLQFDVAEEWSAASIFESTRAGVDVTFSSGWAEWEVFYVAP